MERRLAAILAADPQDTYADLNGFKGTFRTTDFGRFRISNTRLQVRSWLTSEVPDAPIEVRSSPSSRHSGGDVRFRAV